MRRLLVLDCSGAQKMQFEEHVGRTEPRNRKIFGRLADNHNNR